MRQMSGRRGPWMGGTAGAVVGDVAVEGRVVGDGAEDGQAALIHIINPEKA